MSWQATNWAAEQRVGDPTLKLLLIVLCNYVNSDNETWYSQDKISFDTEIPIRTLRRKLHELVEMNLISITERRRPDGTKTTSMIEVLMPNVGSATKVKYGVSVNQAAKVADGTSGQNGPQPAAKNPGQPSANKVAGQESPGNNQEQLFSELSLGAPAPSGDLEKQFFDRAVQIITSSPKDARSTAASLRKACGMDIAKARSALELSSGKSDPAHWIRGHIAWLKKKSDEPTDSTVLMSGADDRHVLM